MHIQLITLENIQFRRRSHIYHATFSFKAIKDFAFQQNVSYSVMLTLNIYDLSFILTGGGDGGGVTGE